MKCSRLTNSLSGRPLQVLCAFTILPTRSRATAYGLVSHASQVVLLAFGLALPFGRAIAGENTDAPHLVTRARYIIEAGDKIDLVFRRTPELNQTVTVQPDGFVTLQPIGEFKVSGLAVTQATERISAKAKEHLVAPEITLTLKEFHKPFFVVAGEVQHPARFDMDEPTTAIQAVLEAGGMTAAAKSSQIVLFRHLNAENDEVHILDLHNIKKEKNLEHDIVLEPGDMLLVPRDRISQIDRVIRAANTGLYFNPASF